MRLSRRELLRASWKAGLAAAAVGLLGYEYLEHKERERERRIWFSVADLPPEAVAERQQRLHPQLRELLSIFGLRSFSQIRTIHGPKTWGDLIDASDNDRRYPLVELDLSIWEGKPVIAHDNPDERSPDFYNASKLFLPKRQIIKLDLKDQDLLTQIPQLVAALGDRPHGIPQIINWSIRANHDPYLPAWTSDVPSPIIISPDFHSRIRRTPSEERWRFLNGFLQSWPGGIMLPWPFEQAERHWPLLRQALDEYGGVLYLWQNTPITHDQLRHMIGIVGEYRVQTIFDIPDQRLFLENIA